MQLTDNMAAVSARVLRVRRFGYVTAALAAIMAWGQTPAVAETLGDTLAQTYRYNPQLDAERARLRATDEDVARANSGYRPSINASGDVGHEHNRSRTSTGTFSDRSSPKGYAVQLVQPIFRGFQTTNAVNAAEANVRAGRESLRQVEQDVLLSAVTAYGDVVRDQAVVRLRENNLKFLTAELKATEDRFSVGEVTKTDVAQAQARRALAQSDLDLSRANLKSSRAIYEQIVGSPPQNLVEPNPNVKLVPRSVDEAIGIGTRENPAVVGSLYTEQAARYIVDQIRGELLPEASVEATYQDRFDSSSTNFESESASVVGRLNVPIYANGGEVYARVRQAKHTHVAAIQAIEQARASVQSQVVQAWSQLQGFKAQLRSDRSQISANTTALSGVREEEKVGQRTLLDVLNAQQELLSSQVQLETTKRNVLVASYSVVAAIGRLNVAEVGAVDAAYDPQIHYEEVRSKWWGIDITHQDGRREHMDLWKGTVEHEPAMK
jgi:outer membrane protein